MAVIIDKIIKGSYADILGIKEGESLLSINGHNIIDILDYRFHETNSLVELVVCGCENKTRTIKIKKTQYETIGLDFNTYLIDKERSCKNKCIFCFIDQLPEGMRETMYFKDDDTRLSFLFGNYITLTNIDESEIQRIIDMRISPINISVHTMNPELRCKMMKNRFAGEKLKYIHMLVDGGIKINCQLVMCPQWNDGEELEYTLNELSNFGENLQSVACVPVGLTRYREGLEGVKPYDEKSAGDVIDIIEKYGDLMFENHGGRTFFPSDEFYIIANRELPEYDFYEDFSQLENGVGMFRDLEEGFLYAVENLKEEEKERKITVSMATGEAIYPLLNKLLDELRGKCNNLIINLYPIKNDFFGGTVDVSGLIVGRDVIKQLKGKDLGDKLLIPTCMLKADEDIFLDDVLLEDIKKELNVTIDKVENNGEALVKAILMCH